jgi:hypothetical protein
MELVDPTAGAAAEVVMVLTATAGSVERFAGVGANDVDLSGIGHLAQLGVDRGEADRGSCGPQGGMELLGGPEAIC